MPSLHYSVSRLIPLKQRHLELTGIFCVFWAVNRNIQKKTCTVAHIVPPESQSSVQCHKTTKQATLHTPQDLIIFKEDALRMQMRQSWSRIRSQIWGETEDKITFRVFPPLCFFPLPFEFSFFQYLSQKDYIKYLRKILMSKGR